MRTILLPLSWRTIACAGERPKRLDLSDERLQTARMNQ